MLRAFNCFQITVLFMVMPFIIQWVDAAEFRGHKAAFWVLIVSYVVMFYFNIIAWYALMEETK